ncbi:ATP-binding protein [Streptomyces boluensis]|uniref:ATP-binding protein n=1 Tax=Streptomyces boluensis TaxID=1775135 RepID=A0A964UWQ0_9ACTN|nr:ATP-binding protein [Streptomyces boluensis]NBE55715.1 ATP-binding protein [Streptomyces boluensis]
MKHSAAKSLGVAALGAAFAAAGAGSASAVAPALPDAAATVGTVTSALPEQATKTLPAALPTDGSDPVSGLIGGLPVGKGLPVQGLPVGG